jgi:hypothetical protein
VELTKRQEEAIEAGRKALRETIRQAYPLDVVPLVAVGIVGMFADVIRASAASRELIEIVNRELAQTGLEVVRKRRH